MANHTSIIITISECETEVLEVSSLHSLDQKLSLIFSRHQIHDEQSRSQIQAKLKTAYINSQISLKQNCFKVLEKNPWTSQIKRRFRKQTSLQQLDQNQFFTLGQNIRSQDKPRTDRRLHTDKKKRKGCETQRDLDHPQTLSISDQKSLDIFLYGSKKDSKKRASFKKLEE